MDPFGKLCQLLQDVGARFVLIGVWGANYYAYSGATLFTTHDRDLFLPPDPAKLIAFTLPEQ